MKKKHAPKPTADTVWLKVPLPKELHKRLAKRAIDEELTLPKLVEKLLRFCLDPS